MTLLIQIAPPDLKSVSSLNLTLWLLLKFLLLNYTKQT
jgi:hypothetical protein